MLKLSLIIVTKNRAQLFRRAMAALIEEKQKGYNNCEIVVVDGGSTDATLDVIRENESHIDRWMSKPDRGVSEGVNRAVALATGDVLWFTGDDDVVIPGASVKMMAYLDAHPEIDVLFGHNRVRKQDDDGNVSELNWVKPYTVGAVTKKTICRICFKDYLIPETGFFRKRVVEKVGGYNLDFHYVAYWDFFFRLHQAGARMFVIPEEILTSYQTTLSDTTRMFGTAKGNLEYYAVVRKHAGLHWVLWHKLQGDVSPANLFRSATRAVAAHLHIHPRLWRDRLLRKIGRN